MSKNLIITENYLSILEERKKEKLILTDHGELTLILITIFTQANKIVILFKNLIQKIICL